MAQRLQRSLADTRRLAVDSLERFDFLRGLEIDYLALGVMHRAYLEAERVEWDR